MSLFDNIGGPGSTDNILKNITGGFFNEITLKDYAHASKLMVSDGMALAPNHKFLFHVYFNLTNPELSANADLGLVGALVKTVQLPSYEIDTQEYIQYNRKRLVHNRINYQPVTIKLHDDSSDNVRSMWYNYYNYHFADPSYAYEVDSKNQSATEPGGSGIAYKGRDIYETKRAIKNFGFDTKSPTGYIKPAFFRDIKIYGMSRGKWISYTLINPVITRWEHDTYDYSDSGGVMEHTMTIKYEAVKYHKGTIGEDGDPITGFSDVSRYDRTPGALGNKGAVASFNDSFGILDAGEGILEDLASGNIAGAVQRAARSVDSLQRSGLSLSQIIKRDAAIVLESQLSSAIRDSAASKRNATGPNASYPRAGQNRKQIDDSPGAFKNGTPWGPKKAGT